MLLQWSDTSCSGLISSLFGLSNDCSVLNRSSSIQMFYSYKYSVIILGVVNIVRSELIVSSPDEISRERLEREATLLDSVERETECEAVTEREDTYEVIFNDGAELKSENYSIGMRVKNQNKQ